MQLHWHTEPLLLLGILGAGWIYCILVGPFRSRIAPDAISRFPLRHSLFFFAALALFYLAVGSPLDQLGEQFLFSAHMVQHLILIYIIPFLLFWGTPLWLVDGILERHPLLRRITAILTNPLVGGTVFTLVLTLWHVPLAYEAALQNRALHVLEHLTMFFSAVLMLWCFASPSRLLPAAAYGVRMLTIFVLMVAQIPLFAFLTFADSVHYPTYEWAPRIIPWLDPLGDQILGGLIMKVSNMVVSLTIFGLSFYLWVKREHSESESMTYTAAPTAAGTARSATAIHAG